MKTITQTQISAFESCRFFYYLKYVRQLVWPVSVPAQQNLQEGNNFHLLVRQLILGFPPETLLFPTADEKLRRWISIWQREKPLGPYQKIMAEKEASANYADVLWLGKFDALTVNGDRLTVFDWKTGSAVPDAAKYRTAPQTRLYCFLARSCAPRLLGSGIGDFPAENIEMVYWFPEHPDHTLRFSYSDEDAQRDLTYLRTRAREMSADDASGFPRTSNLRRCGSCEYRSYCFPVQSFPVDGEDLIPPDPEDEVYQDSLFPPDPFAESDQEAVSF